MSEKQTLGDLFLEEETRMLEQGRKEIAQETAAWEALSQADKDLINAKREAKFANLPEVEEEEPEDDEEE